MTLQERLENEEDELFNQSFYEQDGILKCKAHRAFITKHELDRYTEILRLHTIEQTIKEGCEVVEELSIKDGHWKHDSDKSDWRNGYNQMRRDSQHALRGIIK